MVVIDASVAVKWVIHEKNRESARELLVKFEEREIDLCAPSLIEIEVENVLSKYYRLKKFTRAQAEQALQQFRRHMPAIVMNQDLQDRAFDLSLTYRISLWDSYYLALAVHSKAGLITADRRFHRSIARHYPDVRLLA